MKTFSKKGLAANLTSSLILLFPALLFAAETIKNPLASNDVNDLLTDIMKLVVTAGAIVVVFFIIYSGYKFVAARGNPSQIEDAKKTFYATVIGGAILLGADVIANVVVKTVNTTVGRTP
jgi:hypothetical protein